MGRLRGTRPEDHKYRKPLQGLDLPIFMIKVLDFGAERGILGRVGIRGLRALGVAATGVGYRT